MSKQAILIFYLFLLSVLLGCQEKQKPASLEENLKQLQKKQLADPVIVDYYSCSRMFFMANPHDIIIARFPGIEQKLYLNAVDKDNKSIYCEKPMRIIVDNNGSLLLNCPGCGRFKPLAVKDDSVIVEPISE